MKRIAGNIINALMNTFKGEQVYVATDNVRCYDTDPRESRAEVPDTEIENGVNTRGSNSLDRAYASGSKSAEIQFC